MKHEPIPESNFNPFPEGSFTPHPWVPEQTTFTSVADGAQSNGIAGGLPAGDNPLGRSAMTLEPHMLIDWKKESE
jgi:hypothetical protein